MALFALALYFAFVANIALSALVGLDSVVLRAGKKETFAFKLLSIALGAALTATLTSLVAGDLLGALGVGGLYPFVAMGGALAVNRGIGLLARSLGVERGREGPGEAYPPLLLSFASALLAAGNSLDLGASALAGLSCAVGYGIALVLIKAVHERLALSRVPASFRGEPILLISAGLMSLAFLLFEGLA